MKFIASQSTGSRPERMAVIRSRGRSAFIWRRGVLGFGVPWTFAMALMADFATNDFKRPLVGHALLRLASRIVFLLPFGAIAGLFWGRHM
jgi:hypothetical protein